MRIQHNIMAMNAYRNYNTNTSALSKNLEKLSSGYKINRAGDDAAGLAISEKMRAQITGLNAAQKNVKDGISLVKTAEGAMQEIQDMLNRMDYLATQSANGTYDDPVDRYNLQKEVNQLRSEIDRIADSANFNGIKLLNGDQSLAEAQNVNVNVTVDAVTSNVGVSAAGGTLSNSQINSHIQGVSVNGTTNSGLHPGDAVVGTTDAKFSIDISGITVTGVSSTNTVVTITVAGVAVTAAVTAANGTDTSINGTQVATAFNNATVAIDGVEYKMTANAGKITFQATTAGTADGHATTINNALLSEVQVDVAGGTNAKVGGSWIHGVQDVTLGVDTVAGKLAGVSFRLDSDIVADGNTLTIGDQTFTFKVGPNSGVTATGANVIDLTKYTAGTTALFEAAAVALASSNITIADTQTVGSSAVTTNFKISSVDGNIIHIDQTKQTAANTDDVTYNANMLKGLFTVVQKETAAVNASVELSATPGAASGLQEGDMVSYKTTNDDGEEVYKTYTIGTAPADAKDPDKYISADAFNALFQNDATKILKDAADKVLSGTTYSGFTATVNSSGNVVVTARSGSGADDQDVLDDLQEAIQAEAGNVRIYKISKDDAAKGLQLQIGDTSDSFNQLRVNVGDMHVKAMGTMETKVEGGRATAVKGKSIDDIDISTQAGAQEAVDIIKNAINYVSSIRGDLGATQNRLEHTANNLSVMAENIQDAESTIRDTDIADEMMAYTKNNILVQSAQAMLAQANAVPQGVLQLLG